jgi:hypothetical protein
MALQLGGMDHIHYSPNLALDGLHLFGPLKKHLDDKWFATNADVKQAVTSWLQALDIDFFYSGDTVIGDTMGHMLKCDWGLHGGLMCTVCYECAM